MTAPDRPSAAASGRRNSQSASSGAASQISPEERIWLVVAAIPYGRVASYGQIARLAGMPSHARFVGRTLSRLPADTALPWHRVVNARLEIAQRAADGTDDGSEQRRRLQDEGIEFVGRRIVADQRWEN